MLYLYLYLYLLWRNTLTHLWSGGSEWNTLAHECARTLGSLWFFGHQEPSQRQRALNWIANSDAPETWGDDACAIHGASTSGRMQFENLARHSRCIWRFVKMSVPGFVDKSQFHACRLMFAFKVLGSIWECKFSWNTWKHPDTKDRVFWRKPLGSTRIYWDWQPSWAKLAYTTVRHLCKQPCKGRLPPEVMPKLLQTQWVWAYACTSAV